MEKNPNSNTNCLLTIIILIIAGPAILVFLVMAFAFVLGGAMNAMDQVDFWDWAGPLLFAVATFGGLYAYGTWQRRQK